MAEVPPDNELPRDTTSRKIWIVIIVSVVVIVATGLSLVLLSTPAGPLRIESISISPENPVPGDTVTIIAEVKGGSALFGPSVDVHFGESFGSGRSGGGTMLPVGNNNYQQTMRHSIPDGTEVWLVVSASTNDEGPIYSEIHTFQVGEIMKNGSSGLKIETVFHTPENPISSGTVIVSARVVSNVNITNVELSHMYLIKTGGGGGGGSMSLDAGDNYTGTIDSHFHGSGGLGSGVTFFYRVWAMDESGNCAISEVHSFTTS